MNPNSETASLEGRRLLLQLQISEHRRECAIAAAELMQPIEAIERGIDAWRQISPVVKLLAIPGGLIVGRMLGHRSGDSGGRGGSRLAVLISALPLVIRGVKLVQRLRSAPSAQRTP